MNLAAQKATFDKEDASLLETVAAVRGEVTQEFPGLSYDQTSSLAIVQYIC